MTEVQLKVMEASQEEAYKGIVRIDSQTMRKLGIRPGEFIEIEGERKTVAIVERAYPTDLGQSIIRMDGIIRRNAKTGISELVKVRKADIKEAKSIKIAPAQKGMMIQANPQVFKRGLLGRAVIKGDILALGGTKSRRRIMSESPFQDIFDIFEQGFMGSFGFSDLRFIVVDTNPKQPVIVTENTAISVSPQAVEVKDEQHIPEVSYEDIGGLDNEIKKVREMVELPLKHPEIFERLGVQPPKGILMYGPPGTGKTLLAKAVASESDANFVLVNGPEITSKFYGETEKRVRQIFEQAEKEAPSIIFIDEIDAMAPKRVRQIFFFFLKEAPSIIFIVVIDAMAPKREETHGEVERRMVSQLLTCMDGLKSRGKVVVIGATNRHNALDPALRRPGRFDREIQIGVPNKKGRLQVLKVHTRNMPLTKDVDLDKLAAITHGFVGADLEALCKEAAMMVLRKILPELKLQEDTQIPKTILDKLKITQQDFIHALRLVRPSAMREVLVETPNVKWEDVGGLVNLKQELKEAVEWPIKNPESFKRLGIRAPKGILMYGPPGTGKTLLAKAVASESEANFILVKGPELLNKWVGESLPYDEELIVRKDNKILRMKIGDIVENKENLEVLTFDRDKRVNFSKINNYIKHPQTSHLLEITTKTGRKIKVTSDHSLFTFINGKLVSVPSSYLIPNESHIAIPKRLNLPRERINSLNLYKNFKKDKSVFVANIKNYLIRAKKILGLEKVAKILGISKKYVAELICGNLPISIIKFNELIKESKLAINYEEIKIKLKGSIHKYPAIFNMDKDFWRLVGLWVAEGDLNGYTVRIHNINPEIRQDAETICKKYGFSISSSKTCFSINSLLVQKIFTNVLGLKAGAKNKRIPALTFILDKESKANLLKGYFSGDGSIYSAERGKFKIEAGTISKELANDLLYLLLDFGIVATIYKRKERTNSITYRISILGVNNFERFSEIGFIDSLRKSRIKEYIESRKWFRSDLIPLSGELYEITSQNINVSNAIGKHRLKQVLLQIDGNKQKYKEYWDLVEGDIYFDLVKEIKIIDNKKYVYDISVPDGQNFIAGFGGIFAHNSEKGVRKVFERARQAAPTIIFFDEIDALASARGRGADNGVSERVVNALLSEMDGLEELQDVVVIAATNRPDLIDPGLLRPGRFDRIISTTVPDKESRLKIFEIHTKGMPLAKDVDLKKLVEKTNNYSGADISGVCREAGLLALREDIKTKDIKMKYFEQALEKVRPSITDKALKKYKKIEEEYLKVGRGVALEKQDYFG